MDTNKRKMVLANNTGGLSGPAVRPVALRMGLGRAAKKVHIPIIGMGGIETGEDAAAFMLCGAKAVMVGTANFTDPFACPRIIRELDAYCDRQNVRSAQELVGTLEENGITNSSSLVLSDSSFCKMEIDMRSIVWRLVQMR